jgi:large conductance mechanosensitive channel
MRDRHNQSKKDLLSKKEAFDLLKEFKRFIFRGSFLDLSVGVIIGGSFNKIISSLVDNILMPIISLLLPFNSSYKNWALDLYGKQIPFGLFIGDVITFLMVSFFLFLFIKKLLYWLFEEEQEEKKNELTLQEKTLLEIKEILSQRP